MDGRFSVISATMLIVAVPFSASFGEAVYQVKAAHPRLFIEDVQELAQRCDGPLAEDYRVARQRADDAVRRGGIQYITNAWSIPEDLMNCGIAYLVERQRGRDARPYADVIIRQWGDGSRPAAFARAAPMLRDGLSQWFSDRGREWLPERWQRVACYNPSIPPMSPDALPLGYLFAGAGHVYMRSSWNDPNATWAFFGCGPQFAGHSRDDDHQNRNAISIDLFMLGGTVKL